MIQFDSVMIPAHIEEKVIRNILNDLICQNTKTWKFWFWPIIVLIILLECKSVSDERIKVLDIQTVNQAKPSFK